MRRTSTVAAGTAVTAAAACLVLAVLARRADLVVVATPFVVCLLDLLRRRSAVTVETAAQIVAPTSPLWEGDGATAQITIPAPADTELVRVALTHGRGLTTRDETVFVVVPGETVRLHFTAARWGRQAVGPVRTVAFGAHALTWASGPTLDPATVTVLPHREVFAAASTVPRASGLAGTHRSGAAGAGTDLRGIAPFQPGDRLRRITWPTSLRTGRLHVSTTTEDRDAEVLLVLDAASDIGTVAPPRVTSLDVTVRAAAAIATHYLDAGDRVGAVDLGTGRPLVRLSGSRRHVLRLLTGLLPLADRAPVERGRQRRLQRVPARGLVIALSPLLDEGLEADLAGLLRRAPSVLVIDTLPDGAAPTYTNPDRDIAWRLARLAREQMRERLTASGCPVVAWQGPGTLDIALRSLARAAALPRRRR